MTVKDRRIDFKYNFGVYFSFIKKYKLLFTAIIIAISLVELRSIVEKFIFKAIIDNGTNFSSGKLSLESFTNILTIIAIIFISVLIAGVIIRWLFTHMVNRLGARLMLDLKKRYFDHLISLDHNFHVTHKTGSLISRLSRGHRAIDLMTDIIAYRFAPMAIELIIVLSSLVYFNWITAVVSGITLILFISFSFIIQRMQEPANITVNEKEDIEKANVGDIFTNIDSIKYFGKENLIKNKFAAIIEATRSATVKNWDYFKWLEAIQITILGIGTFFIIYFPIIKFLHGEMSLGTLTFIYTAFGGLTMQAFNFVWGLRDMYRAMADFQDLFEYGKIKKEILDKPNAKELKIKQGEIEFKNITFKYGKRTIFHDFNLKIPQNKKIALVGHSGCGKTTLVKLLYRMYDVNKGQILIDSADIRDIKQESLREEMAIVPQECVLFDDTIFNNVAFSNPKATKEEVFKAIKFAQLDKIIDNFPKKEKTIVGERGVRLSGGEKQRVSIARAILADKKVLVLDEATSSLDSQTEHEIQKDLEKLMQGRTSIIIAHRLSTIMNADKIIVMKSGKIVQEGTHSQLISKPGEYRTLWNLQKGGYIRE